MANKTPIGLTGSGSDKQHCPIEWPDVIDPTVILISDAPGNCLVMHDDGLYLNPCDCGCGPSCDGFVAGFTATDVDPNGSMIWEFEDNSAPPTGGVLTDWKWFFGDGQTGSGSNPTHSYMAPGNYDVVMVVSDNNGCTEATHKIIAVANPCAGISVDFVSTHVDADYTFSAIAVPSHGGGSIAAWAWDFGDSNTSTIQNPTHTYTVTGTYTVELTVTDDAGCTATKTATVYITVGCDSMEAMFVTSGNYLDWAFTDTSTPSAGATITTWAWDFGDSNTSTIQNPTHTYASAGTYTVTLTVTDDAGCTKTTTRQISVTEAPVGCAGVSASFTTSTTGSMVTTDASASTPSSGATITEYKWTWGDLALPLRTYGVTQTHDYSFSGHFVITLEVTDSNGCTATHTETVTVPCAGVNAVFTVIQKSGDSSGCVFLADASASSPSTGNSIMSYEWRLDNPNKTYPDYTGVQANISVADSNTHTLYLRIRDDVNCIANAQEYIACSGGGGGECVILGDMTMRFVEVNHIGTCFWEFRLTGLYTNCVSGIDTDHISWYVDGNRIPGANGSTFHIDSPCAYDPQTGQPRPPYANKVCALIYTTCCQREVCWVNPRLVPGPDHP